MPLRVQKKHWRKRQGENVFKKTNSAPVPPRFPSQKNSTKSGRRKPLPLSAAGLPPGDAAALSSHVGALRAPLPAPAPTLPLAVTHARQPLNTRRTGEPHSCCSLEPPHDLLSGSLWSTASRREGAELLVSRRVGLLPPPSLLPDWKDPATLPLPFCRPRSPGEESPEEAGLAWCLRMLSERASLLGPQPAAADP